MIDYLHETEEDVEDSKYSNIPTEERQLRERLRLTIGELKVSKEQGTYWSTDDRIRKLLRFRPSIKDMELIQRPMCYLPEPAKLAKYENTEDKTIQERRNYFVTLQKELIEYFLDQYLKKNK